MNQIGFTGTQRGMTDVQKKKFEQIFLQLNPINFRHGDCVGADAQASNIAELRGVYIICHPPKNRSKRAFMPYDKMMPAQDYLIRNHDIVDECEHLIACPGESTEQLRSGTWATIRYARKINRPITIIYPDGSHVQEDQTSVG